MAKYYEAQFGIYEINPVESYMIIRDMGPWDLHPTVTNDAKSVVMRVYKSGVLEPGMRLFYFDSEGRLDELLMDDAGGFHGFRSGAQEDMLDRSARPQEL